MSENEIKDNLKRVIFFCQMFNYGFGRACILTINDPVAFGYNTFADIHLLFTMFLVEKKEKPIGGFIYPILLAIGEESLIDEVCTILAKDIGKTSFEEYLRKYRNKLATHGDLSADSLPQHIKKLVSSENTNDRIEILLDELRNAVDNLLKGVWKIGESYGIVRNPPHMP